MPQAIGNHHVIEIAPESRYARQLPTVSRPERIMSHLHNKTHFKSTRELQGYSKSRIDFSDQTVRDMVKDI